MGTENTRKVSSGVPPTTCPICHWSNHWLTLEKWGPTLKVREKTLWYIFFATGMYVYRRHSFGSLVCFYIKFASPPLYSCVLYSSSIATLQALAFYGGSNWKRMSFLLFIPECLQIPWQGLGTIQIIGWFISKPFCKTSGQIKKNSILCWFIKQPFLKRVLFL